MKLNLMHLHVAMTGGLAIVSHVSKERVRKERTAETHETHECSFCGSKEVKVIAGYGVFICFECVKLCKGIVDEGSTPWCTSSAWGSTDSREAGW